QYYCPMHPSIVQDHPGECPICSMTLVAREGGKGKAPAPSGMHKASAPPTPTDGGAQQAQGGEQRGATGTQGMAGMPGMQMPEASPRAELDGGTAAGAPGREGKVPAGLGPVNLTSDRIQLLGMRTAQLKLELIEP